MAAAADRASRCSLRPVSAGVRRTEAGTAVLDCCGATDHAWERYDGQRGTRSNVSSRDVPPLTALKTRRPPTNEYRVACDIAARKRSSTSIAGEGHAIFVSASGPTAIAPGDFSTTCPK